jgi:hypothetical protein
VPLKFAADISNLLTEVSSLEGFQGGRGACMQDEAEITISGVKLTHDESMTVRVAIDTLANVLAEGLEEGETRTLTDRYLESLGRIQTLLESREARKQ